MPEHNTLTDPELHEPKGISSAPAGAVLIADGAGSGSWVVPFDKRKIVRSKSDLPTPVSGVITLSAETEYLIADDINLGSDRIVMGNDTVFRGLDENVITMTYTGTGYMFTASDVSCRFKAFTFNCLSGTFIKAENTAGNEGTDNVIIDNVDGDCDRLGDIANLNIFGVFRNAYNTVSTRGYVFTGTAANAVVFSDSVVTQAAGAFLDLGTATFLSFDINNYLMVGSAGTTFLTGAAGSANIRTGGLGRVIRGRNFGSETLLSGITTTDNLWEFALNDKISDTRPDSLIYMQGNATDTVIATAGVYVKAAGTWTVGDQGQFTGDTTGRATYKGGKTVRLPITISATVKPVSGTGKDISIRVAVNGTTVAGSQRTVNVDAADSASVTIPWQESLTTDEYVELFVTNDTDTTDILVSSAVLRIN